MSGHRAWMKRNERSDSSLLGDAAPVRTWRPGWWPWRGLLGAVLSLGTAGWPGWMLVTRQWSVYSFHLGSGSGARLPPFESAVPSLESFLPLCGVSLVFWVAVSKNELRVALGAMVLSGLMWTNTVDPVLGGLLLLLALVGAISAIVMDVRERGAASTTGTTIPEAAEEPSVEHVVVCLSDSQKAELPEDVALQARRIAAIAEDAMPRLGQRPAQLQTVKEAVEQLMPTALTKYLALPADFREQEVLLNGKTAGQNLREQLATLEHELRHVQRTALHMQSHDVLAHGNYLHARFPGDPTGAALQLAGTGSATETLGAVLPPEADAKAER